MAKITVAAILALLAMGAPAEARAMLQRGDTLATNVRRVDSLSALLRRLEAELAMARARVDTAAGRSVADLREREIQRALAQLEARVITRKEFDRRVLMVAAAQADSARRMLERETVLERQFAGLIASTWSNLPAVSLGMGLRCNDCSAERSGNDGAIVWSFRSFPVIGAIERGSVAERIGLRQGDTLRTIDDIAMTQPAAGRKLGALSPGTTVKLGWNRAGVSHTATITLPRLEDVHEPVRTTQSVGNARVEVMGRGASWTRDPLTGALRVTGDSITVIVHPPGGTRRDTVRSGGG
jgi:hypothetical protein